MSNEKTGISAYNKKHIEQSETLNIERDLNVEQITEFFNCKTLIGKVFLKETLSSPVNSTNTNSVLKRRQQAIKALVENPTLKEKVEKLLDTAQTNEQEVITLFSDFFVGKTCPELKQLALMEQQKSPIAPIIKFLHINPTGKTISSCLNIVTLATLAATIGKSGNIAYNYLKAGINCNQLLFGIAYLGLLESLTIYMTYKDYSHAAEKRKKIHALNQLIVIAAEIESICRIASIENQFKLSAIKDKTGISLIEKLKHNRYKEANSLFFMTPPVHSFLYRIYEQEKYLSELFSCIAEMDAYNSIATKIIEAKNTSNKFCFVEFSEASKPSIQSQGFWNVLVKDAIPNTITEDRNIILTGPNAGGKTTAIRALLQNILLGQSFGVAAAETCSFTMFDVIYSYLNISDDILNGLSLFASEIKRAQDLLERMKTLAPNQKFFFALDELFTGTVSEDGEACAYGFVKKLQTFNNTQFIYATHFDKLKELGTDNTQCANYKVDAPTKDQQGKLVYPFTLSQGANESRVALDLAKAAGLFS